MPTRGAPGTAGAGPTDVTTGSGRAARGMVTAEIAVGMIALVMFVAMAAGLAVTAQLQARCLAAAAEIARFEVRDDRASADRAAGQVPPGAEVSRTREGAVVVVVVRAPVRLAVLPVFWVEGRVETLREPER